MTGDRSNTEDSVTVIAEMANAHEGELSIAKEIVDGIAKSADAIKFQVFYPDELVLPSHPDYKEFDDLTMDPDEWATLIDYAQSRDLRVFADVFGSRSIDLLLKNGVDCFKIHNADVSNTSLIDKVGQQAEMVLLSAGGSTWVELADALEYLEGVSTVLMYGYQNYPTAIENANLGRFHALQEKFSIPVGYASHAPGGDDLAVELPRLAVSSGAAAVEVHVTLDRSECGTDYYSSLEPDEFEQMADEIRTVEPLVGERTLALPESEQEYRMDHKKWLVATETINPGEYMTPANTGYRRLQNPPIDSNLKEDQILNRSVTKPLNAGDPITFEHMDAKVVATLACRSESTRLYGKPLQNIGDSSILTHLVNQIRTIDAIDETVLAIADTPSKESFIDYARSEGLEYIIGSEEDVLSRLIEAGNAVDADVAVRVTTENPFIYTQNIDELIDDHLTNNYDYSLTEKLPLGASVEIVSIDALKAAHRHGEPRHKSEFCTLFIVENPDSFGINVSTPPETVQRPDIRLTVDNPEDLVVARQIWENVGGESTEVSISSVIEYLDETPELVKINEHLPDGTDESIREVRPFMYGNSNSSEVR